MFHVSHGLSEHGLPTDSQFKECLTFMTHAHTTFNSSKFLQDLTGAKRDVLFLFKYLSMLFLAYSCYLTIFIILAITEPFALFLDYLYF